MYQDAKALRDNPLPVGTVFRLKSNPRAKWLVLWSGMETSESYDGGYYWFGMTCTKYNGSFQYIDPKTQDFMLPASSMVKGVPMTDYEILEKIKIKKAVITIYNVVG